MNRLWVALGAYAVLAILAAATIADQKFKLATLAILAMFAIRSLSSRRKLAHDARDRTDRGCRREGWRSCQFGRLRDLARTEPRRGGTEVSPGREPWVRAEIQN